MAENKHYIFSLGLQDTTHFRNFSDELITEARLSICRNTLSNIPATNGIHHCQPTKKCFLHAKAKSTRLKWALKYQNFNFSKVVFSDNSYFKASTLPSSYAKEVLRRAGET